MKNIRRITAALLAAILLLGVFPAAVGESYSDLANTHWYADSFCAFGIDYSIICKGLFKVLDPSNYMLIKLVPTPNDLNKWSLCSMCVTLDLNADGTYTVYVGVSFLGRLKDSATGSGTWTVRNNELIMKAEGRDEVSIPIRNGSIPIATNGFGFLLVKR